MNKRGLSLLWMLLMTAAAVLMASMLRNGGTARPRELPPPPVVGEAAIEALYATTLPDAAGRPQSLAQWRGRVLVVNYWATWCVPCRDEMPLLDRLQTRYGAKGVQFVGIAADSAQNVADYVRATPLSYPLLVGEKESIQPTLDFGNAPQGVPFSIVLDREGRTAAAVLGRLDEGALEQLLERLAAR
ncbi:MAG: TlpA family protein disulfide reductase [Rhodocyclales bacterium]|nr:TlpA family protein disulfide reductase [Rhodocyclales bacterium]